MDWKIFLALACSLAASTLFAKEPPELQAARKQFEKISNPSESDRENYILKLAVLRKKIAQNRSGDDWQIVDAEIRRHPAPKNSDSKALSNMLCGEWASPRHDYVFKKDGTWSMLPEEPDITHGKWHIEGNQYFDTGKGASGGKPYTIILLNKNDFIFTDGEAVFYETRITD
jgi:hypothetical protein